MVNAMLGSGARSVLRNAAFLFGGQGVTLAVRAIYTVALAIILGPALFGQYNYGIAWYMVFIPFTFLGLPLLLSREIGANRSTAAKLLPQTFAIRAVAAFAAGATSGALALLFEPDHQLQLLLLIMSLALVARSISLWTTAIFVAHEEAHWSFQQDALFRTGEIIIGIGVAYVNQDILAVALVHAVSWALQALRGLSIVQRRYGPVRIKRAVLAGTGAIIRAGIPIGLVGVTSLWFIQGPVVLGRYLLEDPAQLGQLVVAIQMLGYVAVVPQVVAVAAVPVLARTIQRGDGKDVTFLSIAIRTAMVLGALAALTGAAFGESVVRLLLGSSYAEAASLVAQILWAAIPYAVSIIAVQTLMTRREVGAALTVTLVSGIGYTTLLVLLLQSRTVHVVPWGVVVGLSLWTIGLVGLLCRSGSFPWYAGFVKPLLVLLTSAAVYVLLVNAGTPARFLVSASVLIGGTGLFVMNRELQATWRRFRLS